MRKLFIIGLLCIVFFNYWDCVQIKNEKETIQKPLRDSKESKQKEERNKLAKPNSWIIAFLLLIILLSSLIFVVLKSKRMIFGNDRRKNEEHYTKNLEELSNYFEKKGIDITKLATIKLNETKKIIKKLIEEILIADESICDKEDKIKLLESQLNNIGNRLKESKNNLAQDKGNDSFILPMKQNETSYIKAEILISAGPRKNTDNNNDTELGEDVAGIISLPTRTVFWLLDGTSDSTIINSLRTDSKNEIPHLFSSRLLAQNFGYYFKKNITSFTPDRLSDILIEAQKYLLAEWTKRINSSPKEKKDEILDIIAKGFQPLCSTTGILGSFSVNGELHALRTGDSKVFPYVKNENGDKILDKKYELSKDPTSENDRIAFRLDYDKINSQFIIKSNNFRSLIQSSKGLSTVHIFSDGIGRTVEMQLSSDKYRIVDKTEENVSRIPQKTYDDKSLIILERIIT